jgi:hypothetical protein
MLRTPVGSSSLGTFSSRLIDPASRLIDLVGIPPSTCRRHVARRDDGMSSCGPKVVTVGRSSFWHCPTRLTYVVGPLMFANATIGEESEGQVRGAVCPGQRTWQCLGPVPAGITKASRQARRAKSRRFAPGLTPWPSGRPPTAQAVEGRT